MPTLAQAFRTADADDARQWVGFAAGGSSTHDESRFHRRKISMFIFRLTDPTTRAANVAMLLYRAGRHYHRRAYLELTLDITVTAA